MKKRIRLLLSILILALIFPLSSCFFNPVNDDELVLAEKSINFTNLSKDYDVKESNVNIYFYENGSVPLIDVSSFYNMLEGYYMTSGREITTNKLYNRLYITDKNYSYRRVIFDWYYNTVTFKNTLNAYSTYSHGSVDFSAYYDTSVVHGLSSLDIEYYLGNYDIDILYYKEKVLMPISFINFMNGDYYNVIYNGVGLYGYYYGDDLNNVYSQSTLTGSIPEDMKKETKNELLFLLNEKYGLKDYAKVEDYKDYIDEGILNKFMGNADDRNDAYMTIIHKLLNDPHSRMQKLSFYSTNPIDSSNYLNENDRYTKIKSIFTDLRGKSKESEIYNDPDSNNLLLFNTKEKNSDGEYEDGGTGYIYYKGNTLFVSFTDFLVGEKDKVYDGNKYKDDAYLYDTPALLYKALNDAKTNHPDVKNVVIDVSVNGGGYIAACYKILTFLSDNVYFGYSVGKDYTEVYKILGDTNMDGNYSGDEAFNGFNYYILESEGTFSAANAFACFAKYSGAVKTIGKRSGGGMCAVMPYVLSDGTRFTLSDKNSMRGIVTTDTSYLVHEIESGAPVDIPLEYEDFYNFDRIVELINQQ